MNPSRRQFLKNLTVTGSALALAPSLVRADTAAAPQWVVAGPVSQFPKGTTRTTLPSTGGPVLFITHADDGTFLALSASCTHRGCEVEWQSGEKEYVCPCHRGRFDAHGTVLAGPPRRPLPAYPTRVDTAGTLSVNMGGTAQS